MLKMFWRDFQSRSQGGSQSEFAKDHGAGFSGTMRRCLWWQHFCLTFGEYGCPGSWVQNFCYELV